MAGFLATPVTLNLARGALNITLRTSLGGAVALVGAGVLLYAAYKRYVAEPRTRIATPRNVRLRSDVPKRPDV